MKYSYLRGGRALDVRQSVIEEEHARLETPNEGGIATPPRKETFGAEFQFCEFSVGKSCSGIVWYSDVGSILACIVSVNPTFRKDLCVCAKPTYQFQHHQLCLYTYVSSCTASFFFNVQRRAGKRKQLTVQKMRARIAK